MNDRPNILWLMTDEQRADSLGAYGSPWAQTPNLDRLAHQGTRFLNAYTPSPVCVPARASMLTGQAASTTGVLNNHHLLAMDDPPFLTWTLAASGYQVASFGKHHYQCARKAFDVEGGRTLGDKVHYSGYHVDVDWDECGVIRYEGDTVHNWLFAGRFPGTVDETPEMENVRQALRWIRRRDPNRPYLLRLSFNAPHTPVVTPEPYDTMIDPESIDLPIDFPDDLDNVPSPVRENFYAQAGTRQFSPEQVRRTRQCYYGYMACADHCFGVLLDRLREVGELDNTIVAFVSDHGCHLGDHAFYQKQSFYEASVRVPFFFWGEGVKKGQALETPVSSSSLLPTLLEMVGVEVPGTVQYRSLANSLRGGGEPRTVPIFSEVDFGVWDYRDGDRYAMVRDEEWKMAFFRDPRDAGRFAEDDGLMLHNLNDDPGERTNLAGNPQYEEVIQRLMAILNTWDRSRETRVPVLREKRR